MENFVQTYKNLILRSPQICVTSRNVENCPYGDYIFNCVNCYLCFETGGSSDGLYLDNCMKTQSCADCSFARHSELCFECLNIEKCYNCDYCTDCSNSSDLRHCFDCIGCKDCFGCVGLRHKQFQIYNQPYSEEEYKKMMAELAFDEKRFHELELKHPYVNLHLSNSEECVGDYICNSKACYECYDINNMQDCLYYCSGNFNSPDKDCCDIDNGSANELCYDCIGLGYSYNCNFMVNSSDCSACEFGWNLNKCKNCFGCVYLANKEFHILNKPYSEEEYFKTVARLKDDLIKKNQYGLHILT